MSLEQTLGRARTEEAAFRDIYDLTIQRVYAFVLIRLENKDIAMDVCQNVYINLWQALPRFKYISDPHLYAFLFKIARRQIIKARAKRSNNVALDEIFELPSEDKPFEDYRLLLHKVHNLKDKERLCLELRYFKDEKFQDIAAALNITENHAKVLHHRALKKLQASLDKNVYA